MTIILNFALKINGGGKEGGTCEVLDPATPPPPKKNLKRAPIHISIVFEQNSYFKAMVQMNTD